MGSEYVPLQGWALTERSSSSRFPVEAKDELTVMFEGGRQNKNCRVSPQTAEARLRDKFPNREECWLSAKQVREAVKIITWKWGRGWFIVYQNTR